MNWFTYGAWCYTIAACFPFESLENAKCLTFKDICPGLSMTSDFPGHSRSWNFQEKNPGLSRRRGNPGYQCCQLQCVSCNSEEDHTAGTCHHTINLWENSSFHSVNLILFTVLLVHLILRISPHHSHHLRSHHLSLPLPSTPDLKLISFTNPFLHSPSYSFWTAVTTLNLYWLLNRVGTCIYLFLVSFFIFFGHVC